MNFLLPHPVFIFLFHPIINLMFWISTAESQINAIVFKIKNLWKPGWRCPNSHATRLSKDWANAWATDNNQFTSYFSNSFGEFPYFLFKTSFEIWLMFSVGLDSFQIKNFQEITHDTKIKQPNIKKKLTGIISDFG